MVNFITALVVALALDAPALAAASDQGCQSSTNNASGCLGDILAAPAPLAEVGILVIAIGLAVLLKKRSGKK